MIHDAKMPKNRAELEALIARAEAHGGDRVRQMMIRPGSLQPVPAVDIRKELDRAVNILEAESDDYAETVRLGRKS